MNYSASSYTPTASNYSSKTIEDNLPLIIFHIISKQDNQKFSTEEFRYNQIKNKFGLNKNIDHSTFSRNSLPSTNH